MAREITELDLANKGVSGLPDVPGLTTEAMQKKFDEISKELLVPRFNEMVQEVNELSDTVNEVNSNLMNQMVYLWEVGGSTGSKQIDLSQYRFVLITIMVAGFTTQCMLKPSNIQSSSALGYQTQVGVNTANGYVTVNITYDGTTFVFSCDSTIILDVIGIN